MQVKIDDISVETPAGWQLYRAVPGQPGVFQRANDGAEAKKAPAYVRLDLPIIAHEAPKPYGPEGSAEQ